MASDISRSLTRDLIHQLLNTHGRAEMSTDYVRLMEIYCVVKAGGAAAQIEVAKQLEEAESEALREEIATIQAQGEATNRVQALTQEIQEVERSVASRITYLKSIDALEESVVRSCIPLIDSYFASLRTQP